MKDQNTYERITNLLLDNWIIAIFALVAIIISFIPSFRDGILHIVGVFKRIFIKKEKEFIIEYDNEKITFEVTTKSNHFDIVKIYATTHTLGVNAEYKWIEKYYPDYNRVSQVFDIIKINKKQSLYYDIINIVNDKGKRNLFILI